MNQITLRTTTTTMICISSTKLSTVRTMYVPILLQMGTPLNSSSSLSSVAFSISESLSSPSSSSTSSHKRSWTSRPISSQHVGPTYHRRGSLQLWQFLLALLNDPANQSAIVWTGRGMEFKLIEPEEVRNCKLNFVKHTVRQKNIRVQM